jgi:hypothetical protein
MGLFFSCKEASKHVIMAEDIKLSRIDIIKLAIHLNICRMCRDFARQSKLVSNALKVDGPSLKLDPEFKEELNKLIRQNNR